jgi:hypothetical protein
MTFADLIKSIIDWYPWYAPDSNMVAKWTLSWFYRGTGLTIPGLWQFADLAREGWQLAQWAIWWR